MNKLQVFRNEISNYNYYLKKQEKILEEISDKRYELFGIRGLDPSKQRLENTNYNTIELQKLRNIEKYEKFYKEKIKQYNRIAMQIEYIETTLNNLDELTKSIFTKIYIEKKSYSKTCKELNLIDENKKPKIGELQYLMKKAFKEE